MGYKEVFDAMVSKGRFKNLGLRKIIESYIAEYKAFEKRGAKGKSEFIVRIVSLKDTYKDSVTDIRDLLQQKKVISTSTTKLVSKDVSPDEKYEDKADGGCIGCSDPEEKTEDTTEDTDKGIGEDSTKDLGKDLGKDTTKITQIEDAKSSDDVLKYFDADVEKMKTYLKSFEVKTAATSPKGLSKAIFEKIVK